MNLSNADKALIYDDCIRESDRLQRENSKIKSEFVGNIPPHLEEVLRKNDIKIAELVGRLENLFR